MRITIYSNGEVFIPDKLIGFVGETVRTINFTFDNVTGAEGYKLRITYSDDLIYDVPITNKVATLEPSVLREAGHVKAQWIAYAADGSEYTLVAKSETFDLIIGESIGDEAVPIPTYEQIMNACEELIEEGMTKEQVITAIEQIIRTGEVEDLDTGFVTTLKEINHGVGFRVWLGTTAEYTAVDPKETDVLYIRTDDPSADTINTALSYYVDTGWQNIPYDDTKADYPSAAARPKYRKIGKVLYLKGTFQCTLAAYNETFATLPEGYRPSNTFNMPVATVCTTPNVASYSTLNISTSGAIKFNNIFNLTDGEAITGTVNVNVTLYGISFIIDEV